VGADGIGERITGEGPRRSTSRAPRNGRPRASYKVGALYENETRRFVTPFDRFRFPLAAGATWSQFVDNFDESTKTAGQINNYVSVRGWETVVTPAGTFDAIVMRVVMWLDDGTFWRWPTQCNYTVWYAPAVRGVVREVKRAQYLERAATWTTARRSHPEHRDRARVRSRRAPDSEFESGPVRSRGAARSSSSAPPG
jgi:hypothetical protein